MHHYFHHHHQLVWCIRLWRPQPIDHENQFHFQFSFQFPGRRIDNSCPWKTLLVCLNHFDCCARFLNCFPTFHCHFLIIDGLYMALGRIKLLVPSKTVQYVLSLFPKWSSYKLDCHHCTLRKVYLFGARGDLSSPITMTLIIFLCCSCQEMIMT